MYHENQLVKSQQFCTSVTYTLHIFLPWINHNLFQKFENDCVACMCSISTETNALTFSNERKKNRTIQMK